MSKQEPANITPKEIRVKHNLSKNMIDYINISDKIRALENETFNLWLCKVQDDMDKQIRTRPGTPP